MLFSRRTIELVAAYFADNPLPLVVDPVLVASSGARLLADDAVDALVGLLFPLATVVTPNLHEAEELAELRGTRAELAERLHELGAPAVVVTGGHGEQAVDHLFDGDRHIEIAVPRHSVAATHGAGCTHSATLAALLARGESLEAAARGAALAASEAVRHGLAELGAGEGPVDVLDIRAKGAV
jgi:hydroxymethylpyrimidine/phosphomethylpyrimidine kinase